MKLLTFNNKFIESEKKSFKLLLFNSNKKGIARKTLIKWILWIALMALIFFALKVMLERLGVL